MDDAAIHELAGAILKTHGCASEWVEEIPVTERHQGAIVWDGSVHRFRLVDHVRAKECFAWRSETDQGRARFYAVLLVPPIESAADAVRAAILSDFRSGRPS
jgi:hypothetical protein